MTRFGLRPAIVLGAFGVLAAPAWGATTLAVEPRILAQEGLAIALASTVLQSQVDVLLYTLSPGSCTKLEGGGSAQTIGTSPGAAHQTNSQVTVYFDTACKTPYVEASAVVTEAKKSYAITETAAYLGLAGQSLGSMAISETATEGKTALVLIGLGKFTPANGAQPVDLGLTCELPSSSTATKAPCEGGIAQTFPALSLSLASVTPLTLTLHGKGATRSVTFAGKKSVMETGAAGSLSITEATGHSLGIGGSGTAYGSAATKGSAARFALFPPTPTHWAVTDAAHGVRFSLSVVSNTTRNSAAQVTDIASGDVLATIAVDQSGTGSVSYADGTTDAVTSWLLAD